MRRIAATKRVVNDALSQSFVALRSRAGFTGYRIYGGSTTATHLGSLFNGIAAAAAYGLMPFRRWSLRGDEVVLRCSFALRVVRRRACCVGCCERSTSRVVKPQQQQRRAMLLSRMADPVRGAFINASFPLLRPAPFPFLCMGNLFAFPSASGRKLAPSARTPHAIARIKLHAAGRARKNRLRNCFMPGSSACCNTKSFAGTKWNGNLRAPLTLVYDLPLRRFVCGI